LDSRFPELDTLYRDIVLDHFRAPRGRKTIDHPDVENLGLNPLCGDEVKLSLKLRDGRIEDVAVNGRGCAISVASGSMLAELLTGKTRAEVEKIAEAFRAMLRGQEVSPDVDFGDLEALAGVKKLPVRVKCALLAWTTLADALKIWDENGGRGGASTPPSTTEDR
jgi:nitrogen fixation protein NifU and related proteins